MGGVVSGALDTVGNIAGGLPIVGGMAKSALGQGRGMMGMGQQGGQPGGQQGGLMGGKGGGGQGGPMGMLGGLMGGGGKGGGQNPMSQFAQGAARFGNGQNPFSSQGADWNASRPGMPGGIGQTLGGLMGGGGQSGGWAGHNPASPTARMANNPTRQPGYQPPAPNAQTAQLSSDFTKPYGQ